MPPRRASRRRGNDRLHDLAAPPAIPHRRGLRPSRWRARASSAEILAIADISALRRRFAALAYVGSRGEERWGDDDNRKTGAAAMSINELVLVGTGFVLARVVYVFYFSQRKSAEADRA